MTRVIPFLFFFLGSILFLNAQTYFVKYEAGCMDRYEFVTDVDVSPYVGYAIKSNDGSMTQLDIGKEETKWVKTLPEKLTSCSNIQFDKAMALAINNSSVKIYVVRESPSHFNISLVEKATYLASNDSFLEVTMADADFILDLSKMISNKNLGSPASVQEVYLEGTIKYQCLTGYIFRKKDTAPSGNSKEYTIIPAFGVINKGSVTTKSANSNTIRLNKIGDMNFTDAVSAACKNFTSTPVSMTIPNDEMAGTPTDYEDVVTARGVAATPTQYDFGPCNPPTKPGTHIVQKGETLYSIAKRYSITVDQLKQWNGISQNIINICQELVVSKNIAAAPTGTTGATSSTTPKPATGVQNAPATSQYHIVKPGESVEQLAAMYGYTEARFRKMNGLGNYERVYAGQKLFTSDCDCPNTEGVASNLPLPYEAPTERLTTSGNPDVYFRPIKVHEVRDGETTFAIAKLYDTTVDRINELNGLDKNAKLSKGQRIYVQ